MPIKGSTYWTKKRVIKAGFGSSGVLGLFALLIIFGYFNVTEYSFSPNCAGTPSDLCFLCINGTASKIIYIQANDTWMDMDPPIKNLVLKRKWGKYWRTIDLSKPWSKKVKYALKLWPGKKYEFCFYAEKYDPRDVINWSINPIGVWDKALASTECDYETKTRIKQIPHEKIEEIYWEKNDTWENKSVFDYMENVTISKQICKPEKEYIKYAESKFYYKKDGFRCKDDICDKWCDGFDKNGNCIDFPDSNGNSICDPGESDCIQLSFTDKIEYEEIDYIKIKKIELDKELIIK